MHRWRALIPLERREMSKRTHVCMWQCLVNTGFGARGQWLLFRCLGGKTISAHHPHSTREGGWALQGAALPPSAPCHPNRSAMLHAGHARLAKPGFARTRHGQLTRDPKQQLGEAKGDPVGNTLPQQRSHELGHPRGSKAARPPPRAPHKYLCPQKCLALLALMRKPRSRLSAVAFHHSNFCAH